jgi:hypothetical protein
MSDKALNRVAWILGIIVACVIITGVTIYDRQTAQVNKEFRLNLKFEKGAIVNLKIGGRGQIITVLRARGDKPYLVRIRDEDGFDSLWMNEFELETP